MPATILEQGAATQLRQMLDRLLAAAGETLASLIARDLVAQPTELLLTDAGAVLADLQRPNVVVRAAFTGEPAGRVLCLLLEAREAAALAGLLLMTPEDVIQQRRANDALEGDDVAAFGEIASVLCSTVGAVLRDAAADSELQLQGVVHVVPQQARPDTLPDGPLVACRLRLRVHNYPDSVAHVLIERATADAWNQAPVDPTAAADDEDARDAGRGEDDLDDIPAAPVRGVLNAYLASSEAVAVLRRCSRRVGLDLRRHNRAEVPNPAAHRGEIVLMDVPAGQYRQFDWCRRVKEFSAATKVVLLLHHPSRARVTHAFLSNADVILGLPVAEEQMSQKLKALLGP
jgi:hypothetical protein